VARKPGPLEALATEIRQRYGTEIRTLALDLTADDMLKQLEQVTQDIEVGLLIYNAGSMDRMPEFLDDTHEGVLHTIERTLAALAGCGRTVCYAATKAFDQILAEGLWYELRPSGVDVLCLMLGTTRTPAMERLGMRMDDPANPAMDPDDAAREGLEQLPHGPTWIAGEGNRASAAAIASLSRREATEMLSGVGEDVLGDA
jgi:short-subunit dehydrogenase